MKTAIVEVNKEGGYYECGRGFSKAKWLNIIKTYLAEMNEAGKCSIDRLAGLAKISRGSANKAIAYHHLGHIPSNQRKVLKGSGH